MVSKMSSNDVQRWEVAYYGPGRGYVSLNKEEIAAREVHLDLRTGSPAELELVLCPCFMETELREAIVRALPSHKYEQYEHHGNQVWVDSALMGLHRAYCLCHRCEKFKPNTEDNCPKAQRLYELCVEEQMVTPVWECPEFVYCTRCSEEEYEA